MAGQRHWTTTVASLLLLLLGLARGAGGLVLGVQGPAVVDSSRVALSSARLLGAGLAVIAVLAVVAAIRLYRGRPQALRFTLVVLLLFVVDGALNGYLLFGRPDDGGSLVNVGAAVIIGTLAWVGGRTAGPTGT
jgi:hypothetical protein